MSPVILTNAINLLKNNKSEGVCGLSSNFFYASKDLHVLNGRYPAVPVFLSSRWLGRFSQKVPVRLQSNFFLSEVEKKVSRIPNMNFLS